jgi:hypothetical protein
VVGTEHQALNARTNNPAHAALSAKFLTFSIDSRTERLSLWPIHSNGSSGEAQRTSPR